MPYHILDIKTIPLPPLNDEVKLAIQKRYKLILKKREMTKKIQNHSFNLHYFFGKIFEESNIYVVNEYIIREMEANQLYKKLKSYIN